MCSSGSTRRWRVTTGPSPCGRILSRRCSIAAIRCRNCSGSTWPDHAVAYYNRANMLHALDRFDEALASYDRALALRPAYAEVLINRGVTLHALARFVDALASYDAAVVLWPGSDAAFANRGMALHALKRFDEALASFDRALALRPDNAQG